MECSKTLVKLLKEQEKCDLVIALTHMRVPNEINLAEKVPEIDMMLGGHDHIYYVDMINDVFFLKSGSDFQDFSNLKVTLNVEPEVSERIIAET